MKDPNKIPRSGLLVIAVSVVAIAYQLVVLVGRLL